MMIHKMQHVCAYMYHCRQYYHGQYIDKTPQYAMGALVGIGLRTKGVGSYAP